MALKKVVVTTALNRLEDKELHKIGTQLFHIPCRTEEEIITACQDAYVTVTHSIPVLIPFTRNVISKLNKCRLIHDIARGYEGIDVEAATDYGICVSNAGDYCSEEVSDHTMALLLACARKIPFLDRAVRQGKWASSNKAEIIKLQLPTFKLNGQTLGIIGLGSIGRLVVPKAKGFGLRVIVSDPYLPSTVFDELGVESVTFDDLLSQSDFVSINAPLTKETCHLMGAEQFKKMKSTAYVINTARGELIDEEALYTTLSNGYIAGAGLDVIHGTSMQPDHPLLTLDNMIVTAHTAFYSESSVPEMTRRGYEQLGQIFRGEWPTWLVNPEVKENFLKRWGKPQNT